MIQKLKIFTVNIIAGANVAIVAVMLMMGYAYLANPIQFSMFSAQGIFFPLSVFINLLFLFFWLVFSKRRVLIPIIGFICAYFPLRTYMPLNLSRIAPPLGSFKVMSYNVRAFAGSEGIDESAHKRVFEYILQENPDILCIQEDMGYCRRRIAARLDSLYPYTSHLMYNKGRTNGQGVYSRYPILSKERIPYESVGNASYAYLLDVNGDTVLLINNHLETNHFSTDEKERYGEIFRSGLKGNVSTDTVRRESKFIMAKLAEAAQLRAPQADSVHAYIESHHHYPTIVCGDFNDSPLSYARHTIAKGLTDCYVASGLGLGLSYIQNGFFVRIDNILCSSDFTPFQCRVDSRIDASDHYPILCWLKMKPKPQKSR